MLYYGDKKASKQSGGRRFFCAESSSRCTLYLEFMIAH